MSYRVSEHHVLPMIQFDRGRENEARYRRGVVVSLLGSVGAWYLFRGSGDAGVRVFCAGESHTAMMKTGNRKP